MIAIIGCGNPNRSDDGAGPAVIRLLRERQRWSERVKLLDAGTDGMAVMFAARDSVSLILVDASRTGAAAGTLFEVPGAELERPHRPGLNLHDFRWEHALDAGRRLFGTAFPADVTVLLIEAESVALGVELSPPVAAAVGRAADRIDELIQQRLA